MKSIISYSGTPGPDNDPETEVETSPEVPNRKRTIVAGRGGLVAVALLATGMLFAQSTPAEPTNTPTQTPTTTPRTQSPTNAPHHDMPHPANTPTNKGWTKFDDNVGTRLNLKDDQLQRLQGVDRNYQERYTGLGETPWTNAGYTPLTEQRNTEIKSILTPEQYTQYNTTYGGQPSGTAPRKPAVRTGTTTPPTGQH